MWQVAPGARSLVVVRPEMAQSLADLGEGVGEAWMAGVEFGGEGLGLLAEVGDGDGAGGGGAGGGLDAEVEFFGGEDDGEWGGGEGGDGDGLGGGVGGLQR